MSLLRKGLWAPLLLVAAGGCQDAAVPGFGPGGPFGPDNLYRRLQAEDPGVRMEAVLEAGRRGDPKAAAYLVDRLTDAETEIRFAAIVALQKITGQTFDYEYYAPPSEREAAAERWRRWLRQRQAEAEAGEGD